jgi:hypothetical protein
MPSSNALYESRLGISHTMSQHVPQKNEPEIFIMYTMILLPNSSSLNIIAIGSSHILGRVCVFALAVADHVFSRIRRVDVKWYSLRRTRSRPVGSFLLGKLQL